MYIHHSFQIINVTIANGGGLETVGQSILNHFDLNDNNRKKREKKKIHKWFSNLKFIYVDSHNK